MRIKIIKSESSGMGDWYRDSIGCVYEVQEELYDSYIVLKESRWSYAVLKKDCVIVGAE